jgi:hypothetical protein
MVVFGRMLAVGCVSSRSERDETQRQEEQQRTCPKRVKTYAAVLAIRAFVSPGLHKPVFHLNEPLDHYIEHFDAHFGKL